jgi:tetratricopeptide (TPR) repeat protein
VEISECPQCGAAVAPSSRKCDYCKAEFFISSLAYLGNFNRNEIGKYLNHYKSLIKQDPENSEGLLGLGLCYLQTGMYPLAEKCFDKIIELSPEQSKAYYYSVLSGIKGRRINTVSLNEIRKMESYLQTAIQLDDDNPQYKLLFAMLKKDYYEVNGMRVPPPDANQLMKEIADSRIDENEMKRLRECVKVANPEFFSMTSTVSNNQP